MTMKEGRVAALPLAAGKFLQETPASEKFGISFAIERKFRKFMFLTSENSGNSVFIESERIVFWPTVIEYDATYRTPGNTVL